VLGSGAAISAQEKNTLKVPGGLGFSEFKGYETWESISVSRNGAEERGTPRATLPVRAGASPQPFESRPLRHISFRIKRLLIIEMIDLTGVAL
jgi:hypothetical protein